MSALSDACDKIARILLRDKYAVDEIYLKAVVKDQELLKEALTLMGKLGFVAQGRPYGDDGYHSDAWEVEATQELRELVAGGGWPKWE